MVKFGLKNYKIKIDFFQVYYNIIYIYTQYE